MEKRCNIDTKLALCVAQMFSGELYSFLKLISEIDDLCFRGKNNDSWGDFYNCVKKYYNSNNDNNGRSFGSIVCLKGTKKYEYKDLISRYNYIFYFLYNKDVLDKWLNIMAYSESRECFIAFINDFLTNYDFNETIYKNLYTIDLLKIESFEYNKEASLDGEYTISMGCSLYDKGQGSIRGVCCDGEKNWHPVIEIGKYSFDLMNVNYVIKYSKNSITSNGVSMVCNNLLFDTKTLPTYSELYDKNTFPSIDYNEVSIKTKKFNSICNSFEIKNDINTLMKKIEMFLSSCDSNMLDREEIKNLQNQLILLREPYLLFDDISNDLLSQYNENGKLSNVEINKCLSKRKSKNS